MAEERRHWMGPKLRASRLEIDRNDRVAIGSTKLRDGNVARIVRVRVEGSPVAEGNKQTRIIRPHRSDDVLANFQLDDSAYVGKPTEALLMQGARAEIELGLVFETDDVNQH
jgi:hypothetical protein